jgi:sortase A
MSLLEFVVMGLGLSIVLAIIFVGYVLFQRLRIGPGMGAEPFVAGASTLTPVEARPTLVPTFTPTPEPTLAPTVTPDMAEPSPPIAEPTLSPTPYFRPPAESPPTRLTIASIDLDIPVLPVGVKTVVEGGKEKQIWADVPNAGGFHATSAYPGKPGNTVINGHRDILGAVFRNLDRVQVGDEIVLYVDEVAYPYIVTELLTVPETFASARQRAENQRLIGYMPEERLTLVTCTPIVLATHRMLVIAKPPEQALPPAPGVDAESGM